MRTYLECIPCFVRQALDAVRLVTDDEVIHERVLREVLRSASDMDLYQSPPAMGQLIHHLIRELTGNSDPYREIKHRHNRLALELFPMLRARVGRSVDRLETALRLAAAGNIIDMGVNAQLDESCVSEVIKQALSAPLVGDVRAFEGALSRARRILYLTDNAGEIVFDRVLLEHLPVEKVTVAVRGFPVINDATIADAQAVGILDVTEVIGNGSDAPGTILTDCSAEFLRHLEQAELIIAKGQGNYETLSNVPKEIFFLLKAKCPVIAKHLDCDTGSLILRKSQYVRALT